MRLTAGRFRRRASDREPGTTARLGPTRNPKILHRIYFDTYPPYRDPFERYLQTWIDAMPDYRIMRWHAGNLDLQCCDYVRRAVAEKAPVFLSEYFRWKVLSIYGGIYLDADCEVLDGLTLGAIADDVFGSHDYDAALGVEDYEQGFPTAQTVIAKPGCELVSFMLDLYENRIGGPLWHWRELRGLIGPQLVSLYFWDRGSFADTKGMPVRLDAPTVESRVKVYTQDYFSPKFAIDGQTLRESANTCVYHLFANLNVAFSREEQTALRERPLLFAEYKDRLKPLRTIHRIYFGFDGKPDRFADYEESWAKQLPGYRIRKWDASNLPMDLNDYVRARHAEKDHAFLSDYFRWWLLREHGGIYLDADVELLDGAGLDRLVGELEVASDYDAIIGVDNYGGGWYTAHSMMAKRGAAIARFMCEVYERMGPLAAWRKRAFYLWAPQLTALYFASEGHHPDGMGTSPRLVYPEVHGRVKIFPQDYFSPITPEEHDGKLFRINAFTERSILCHHFACSWHAADSAYAAHARAGAEGRNALICNLIDADPALGRLSAEQWMTGMRGGPGGEAPRPMAVPSVDRPSATSDGRGLTDALPAGPGRAGSAKAGPGSLAPRGMREKLAGRIAGSARLTRTLRLADEARDQGAFEAAAIFYAEALTHLPERHDLWIQLGNMFKDGGKFGAAEFAYLQALALGGEDHEAYLQRGHLRHKQGDRTGARDLYERARALAPESEFVLRAFAALG